MEVRWSLPIVLANVLLMLAQWSCADRIPNKWAGTTAATESDRFDLKEAPVSSGGEADPADESTANPNMPHSRKKRLIWITDDGRLALPPGASLSIAPTLGLPFVRYPPDGFLSNITISLPLTIDFDKLGLTDNSNPLGVLPPLLARSMGRAAGSLLANYVTKFIQSRGKRDLSQQNRDTTASGGGRLVNHKNFKITSNAVHEETTKDDVPELPEEYKHAFHGGERALLYSAVEDFLSNLGLDGKACLLRAICEVHSRHLHHFGLLGEIMKLFFTASKSPFSDILEEYVMAERTGEGREGPGECFPYYKGCPKSLFQGERNRYRFGGGNSGGTSENGNGR